MTRASEQACTRRTESLQQDKDDLNLDEEDLAEVGIGNRHHLSPANTTQDQVTGVGVMLTIGAS